MSTNLAEEFLSVAQAAAVLQVSPSTIWRWINQGDVPAYRVGRRRVCLKKSDLELLITPARRSPHKQERATVTDRSLATPLTAEERQEGLAVLKELALLQEEMLRQRGGVRFPDSGEDLWRLRDQRTRDLA
jgi:excisionase family DNA binding protein